MEPATTVPDVELACPLCGYNLRGLTEPRCPECGFAFTWAELLDAKRDRHPWLFEHAARPWSPPRRALRLTAWRAGVRPWRFWRDVSPTNPVRVRRLLVYWALLAVPLALATLTAIAAQAVSFARQVAAFRADYLSDPTYRARVDEWWPKPWTPGFAAHAWRYSVRPYQGPVLAVAAVAAAWPWLTAAALLVFQASLRRARIRPAHVVRAAVYTADVGLLTIAVAVAVCGPGSFTAPVFQLLPKGLQAHVQGWVVAGSPLEVWLGQWPTLTGLMNRWGVPALVAVVVPFAVVSTLRLAVAYRRYMRFDRPLATAVASQAIVVLVVVVAILQLTRAF